MRVKSFARKGAGGPERCACKEEHPQRFSSQLCELVVHHAARRAAMPLGANEMSPCATEVQEEWG